MKKENESSNSSKGKTIVITVVIVLGIILLGFALHKYFEEQKWQKYEETHYITDNLLTVGCTEEEENIVCLIKSKEKTSSYDTFVAYIEYDNNIKYLDYEILNEESLYVSHDNTKYRGKSNEEKFYISGLNEISDLEYLLKVKFQITNNDINESTLKFENMSLTTENLIHHETEDITINIAEIIKPSEVNIEKDGKYKYLCLNKDVKQNEIITKSMLAECASDTELKYGAVTEELLKSFHLELKDTYEKEPYYISISKKNNQVLYIDEIYWLLEPLKKKELTSQTGVKYTIGINDNKELYINDEIVFQSGKVKSFYIRPYCCSGDKKVIIVTENNQVYISEESVDLLISQQNNNIIFKDLPFKNVKEFHINYYVPSMAGTHVYAITNDDEKHLID